MKTYSHMEITLDEEMKSHWHIDITFDVRDEDFIHT